MVQGGCQTSTVIRIDSHLLHPPHAVVVPAANGLVRLKIRYDSFIIEHGCSNRLVQMKGYKKRVDMIRRRPILRMMGKPAIHDQLHLLPGVLVHFIPGDHYIHLGQKLSGCDALNIVSYVDQIKS